MVKSLLDPAGVSGVSGSDVYGPSKILFFLEMNEPLLLYLPPPEPLCI